jgi:hypothetical protein
VDTGSREENASKQEKRASVPIQSERKRLWSEFKQSRHESGDVVFHLQRRVEKLPAPRCHWRRLDGMMRGPQ